MDYKGVNWPIVTLPLVFAVSKMISLRKSISSKRGEKPLIDAEATGGAPDEDDPPVVVIIPLTKLLDEGAAVLSSLSGDVTKLLDFKGFSISEPDSFEVTGGAEDSSSSCTSNISYSSSSSKGITLNMERDSCTVITQLVH
uniref:Uncharacterized protein n=1 Tax=Glossina palpalis gambiensis TaxID=67801 RepID=A0A1B0BQP2_9MUSC